MRGFLRSAQNDKGLCVSETRVKARKTAVAKRSRTLKPTSPEKVEGDLMKIIPQDRWIAFSHELIHHGRQVCVARKPRCVDCTLEKICNSSDKTWSSH